MFSAQELALFLEQMGWLAVLASLVISTLVAIVGVLPSIFVTGANVIVFGIHYGFAISWIGEILGAAISFYLYRWGFKKGSERAATNYPTIQKIVYTGGNKAAFLVFQARVIPFLPSGLVTLGAAISNITFIPYIIATALGKLPSMLLETMLSYDLININENLLRFTVTIIILLFSYFFYRRVN